LIVVDEEHDPSYKQQEGARYSARDLAVWRGQRERVPVLLGSATPSLESWHRATPGKAQRYARVDLRERVGCAPLPEIRLVDMRALRLRLPREVLEASPLAPPVLDAMRDALARGEQAMVLLNRRGYAPALRCPSCTWKSACPHCSAWRVFHKPDRSLRCHHCGYFTRVPRACPECGDLDITALGRGTQKLEEQLTAALPGARILRIDADSVRRKGALEEQLAAVHAGEVDVLVGTQMVAKGHDFRRMTLVVAVDPDGALFTSDFRAPERLFALLMQAAGRAGRDAAQQTVSRMWVQTWHTAHPMYVALKAHDYGGFAATQLEERERAGLPPFASLALLRADAKEVAQAQAFLEDAGEVARALPEADDRVAIYPPVPLPVARVADIERMQMLVESRSRTALQRLLAAWAPKLREVKARHKGVLRYAVDVDPMGI
jgi:primosomal protein N' (replication factor Y) (superfamily II helicase)